MSEVSFDNKKSRQTANNRQGDRSMIAPSQANLFEFEQLSENAVELIFNNKINAKNAFDVNVDYLEKLPNLLKRNEETSWQKASASLDASAKIYGYRVDSVHTETYKILGGLSRAEAKDEEVQNVEKEEGERKKERKDKRHDGFDTLERDIKRLDLVKYDLEFDVDPLFKSMTAKFAEAGARGLLLKNLHLDTNLDVLLESKNQHGIDKKENDSVQLRGELSTDVKSIINNTLSNFSAADLRSIQICPNINYFKKSRQLETSLEKTFYQNLMHEFDETSLNVEGGENILDRSNLSDSFHDSIHVADNEMDYTLSQRTSTADTGLSPNFDEKMNLNMLNLAQDSQKQMGVSYLEGFSYLKSDEIKEYIQNFGDGNKEALYNMPHFKNFAKSFNQLEKFNYSVFNNNSLSAYNDEAKPIRTKKEEILFDFSIEKEVKESEIFVKEKNKNKLITKENVSKNKLRRNNKKTVKQFYFYDKLMLHNLFSIQDRHINTKHDNEEYNLQGEEEGVKDSYSAYGENNNLLPPNEEDVNINVPESFAKIDNEYEKRFGRLYKTFDVRVVKNKIWESIDKLTDEVTNSKQTNEATELKLPEEDLTEAVEFKQILSSVSTTISKDILSNISTPTCFVCLLHLSNEKQLVLEQIDENNFSIRREKNS